MDAESFTALAWETGVHLDNGVHFTGVPLMVNYMVHLQTLSSHTWQW